MLLLFKRFMSACVSQAGAHPCAAMPADALGCAKPPGTGTVIYLHRGHCGIWTRVWKQWAVGSTSDWDVPLPGAIACCLTLTVCYT